MQNHNALMVLAILVLTILCSAVADATEAYAETTGTECKECHVDPLGGGALTQIGQGYLLSVRPAAAQNDRSKNAISRSIRLLMRYIHIVTAFFWFGTILYVHLILKPAYASKGLPRGEVKVGLISMVVMGITGIVLTYYKVPALSLLVSSRFGLLLLAKIGIFTFMVSSAIIAVFVIGPRLGKKPMSQLSQSGELTLSELANFDGQEGRPAHVAFKDRIYDVTESKRWKNGSHMKRHQAGADLTDSLAQAPHGEDKILAMPEVGELSKEKGSPRRDVRERVFYFLAYMNLGFVLLIFLILALWRW